MKPFFVIVAFALIIQASLSAPPESLKLLSRNVPAFAFPDPSYYPPNLANDASYDTLWRSKGTPTWLAYDLSGVPKASRDSIILVWYNPSYAYDNSVQNGQSYNSILNYTIQINQGAGGGQPPQSGWVTIVTIENNYKHSRQHAVLYFTGYNWVRLFATAPNGAEQNYDIAINMDVFDGSHGFTDDWIFYGDSITAGAMNMQSVGNGVHAFNQLINEKASNYYPISEGGGIGSLLTRDGLKFIAEWLLVFPGKYVGISYGTNDAWGCLAPDIVQTNYRGMINAVLNSSKVPVVPHIPWGRVANLQTCVPTLNKVIDSLYTEYGSRLIRGPDLYAFFNANQDLISSDGAHPSDVGMAAYRQQWANAMLTEVYGVN